MIPPESNPRSAPDALQFDRAVDAQAPGAPSESTLTCGGCGKPIVTEYYHVGDQPTCARCKILIENATNRAASQSRRASVMLRAVGLGLAAAIAGAIIYYAVIAITGWEIGLVAIVIGFMVGWAVRKGSGGAGGRRYQILALALTYFAVGLAYAPMAFKAFVEGQAQTDSVAAIADSTTVAAPARQAVDSAARAFAGDGPVGTTALLVALGATFLFIFALPIMVVVGSLPSGLISALIIAFGMQQAWKMTAKADVSISGPYKVGTSPNALPA